MAIRRKPRTKTKVRFWWEIYRTLHKTPELRDALGLERTWNETLTHYKSWGDVVGVHYDDWWKEHRELFLDEGPVVREITKSHFKRNHNCVYLELNLKRSADSLMKVIRSVLREKARSLNRGKNKTRVQPVFSFTTEAEIRPSVYEEYRRFLKEVYAPNCRMRAIQLRGIAQEIFLEWLARQQKLDEQAKKEKKERKRRVPFPSLHLHTSEDKTPIAYVSVNRYLKKVRLLCRAVARGEFPG